MWILGIFGFIGVIGFVIAGIFYLTAGGDAEVEKKAKKAMMMSIVGVIVGLLGLVILNAATSLLEGTDPLF
jgi:Na+/proline symporter